MERYDWSQSKHILCVRPDNMGDVLMTQPAIRALKQQTEGRNITLLTSRMGAEMGQRLPEVDEVMVFDVPWIKTDDEKNGSDAIQQLAKKIKEKQFDASVVFTNYSQSAQPSAMVCYLAGIPQILAFSRENPYKLINNWVPDKEPFSFPVHGVKRQLDLVKTVGAKLSDAKMILKPKAYAKKSVLKKLRNEGLDIEKPWIIVHPGVSEDKREYSVRMYGKAAEMLSAEDYQMVITGLECEDKLALGVVESSRAGSFNLAGKFSLDEFIALISMASVIISNNTASVHIAAAVNTPVVDLYARTNPEHTPWMIEHRTLYFDVPKSIQSHNIILQHTTPKKMTAMPTPKDIVIATVELLNGIPAEKSKISPVKMSWSNERNNGTYTNLQPKCGAGGNANRPLLSKLKGI